MKRVVGDRRECVRFEVFGRFGGTLDVREPAHLYNLTSSGALLLAAEPLAVESMQTIGVAIDGQETLAEVRVRHLRQVPGASCPQYLVGVEFISISSAFQEAVDRLMAYRSSSTETA